MALAREKHEPESGEMIGHILSCSDGCWYKIGLDSRQGTGTVLSDRDRVDPALPPEGENGRYLRYKLSGEKMIHDAGHSCGLTRDIAAAVDRHTYSRDW